MKVKFKKGYKFCISGSRDGLRNLVPVCKIFLGLWARMWKTKIQDPYILLGAFLSLTATYICFILLHEMCRSRQNFWGGKDILPEFTLTCPKSFVRQTFPLQNACIAVRYSYYQLSRTLKARRLNKVFLWREKVQVRFFIQSESLITCRKQGCRNTCAESAIFPEFSRIMPKCSTDQNFWGCTSPPVPIPLPFIVASCLFVENLQESLKHIN